MEVVPLGISQVNWPAYIDFFKQYLNKSPTQNLDAYYMKPDNLAAFLASFDDSRDPRQILRTDNNVLQHVYVTFMVACSYEFIIYLNSLPLYSHIYESRRDYVCVISGNLKQWKESILITCQPTRTYESRVLMNKCLLYLEKAQISEVFGLYRKENLNDQTFILKEKS